MKDVSVSYGNLHAIEDVKLEIEEGDFFGLIGPNGGGKSTIIKVILGLVENCCGTVKIFDELICHGNRGRALHPAHKWSGSIGYVPQHLLTQSTGFPGTVREVVATGLATRSRLLRPLKDNDHKKIDDALHLTGIYELRSRKLVELSGGEQQRALIARALAADPKLLILDEPTSGVDTPHQIKLYSVLEQLNKKFGISIVLSSHDLTAVSKLASKVACINKTLFYHGSSEGFFGHTVKMSEFYGYPVELVSHDDHKLT